MRNHWLEKHRLKNNHLWTAEFSHNGVYILNPRLVDILNSSILVGSMGYRFGTISVIFKGIPKNFVDAEFDNFLAESRNDMFDWVGRLRKYHGLSELEYYELTDLTYLSHMTRTKINSAFKDVEFIFDFQYIHHKTI